MTKPGNWGTWATIELPKSGKLKQISCEMCSSFNKELGKCKKEEFTDGLNSWKKCKHLYFKPRYNTARYWNKVVKERGHI